MFSKVLIFQTKPIESDSEIARQYILKGCHIYGTITADRLIASAINIFIVQLINGQQKVHLTRNYRGYTSLTSGTFLFD